MSQKLFLLELTPELKAALDRGEKVRIAKNPETGTALAISNSGVFSLMRKDTANTFLLPSTQGETPNGLFRYKLIPRPLRPDFTSLQTELDALTPRDLTLGRLPLLTDLAARHMVSLTDLQKVASQVRRRPERIHPGWLCFLPEQGRVDRVLPQGPCRVPSSGNLD